MTDDVMNRLQELHGRAASLPMGPSRIALLEEAVRLADIHRLEEAAFALRHDLVEAGIFGGAAEKAIVAFSWRLAYADRNSEGVNWHSLLWEYKWILENIVLLPEVPRARIEEIAEDITRRYREHGSSLNVIYQKLCMNALAMGEDRATVDELHGLWRSAPRDHLSDCAACEAHARVIYLIDTGRDAEGLRAAGPLLRRELACAEVPHATYAAMLLPLARLGRLDEADRLQPRGYRMIADNRDFLYQVGQHIAYLGLRGRTLRSLKLLESHLGWALATRNMEARFQFDRGARYALDRAARAGRTTLDIRLPREIELPTDHGAIATDDLIAWLDRDLRDIASRFDARNGNSAFRGRIAEIDQWHALADQVGAD